MKISFIIPVYNTENYLSECIESILSQNLSNNYEIILVDDGSTDKSNHICDKFSKDYSFIKTFHQKNGGASSARNLGLQMASGEYVYFVDSDDFLIEDSNLELMISNLDADILQFKMNYYYEKDDKYVHCRDLKNYFYINNKYEYLKEMISMNTLSISPCDKIIKRSILVENKIYFEEGIVGEDIDWSLKLYLYANNIRVVNKAVYSYRQNRQGSVTNVITTKNVNSIIHILEKWVNYNYIDNEIKELYYSYLAYQYVLLLTVINKNNCTKNSKDKLHKFDFLRNYQLNYKVKMCNKAFNIFGKKIGLSLLKVYLYLKNAGILKL